MAFSGCVNDDAFGPSVQGCRGDFDFTLKFEKIFFSIIPSAMFITIAAFRAVVLSKKLRIVEGTWFQLTKCATFAVVAILQLCLIVFSARAKTLTALFITSAILDFAATISMATISFLEHSRSPRPSILLNLFLILLLLFEITQTRTLWLSIDTHDDKVFAQLFTTITSLRAILVMLESKHKKGWLRLDRKDCSPEELSSLYSLSTLFWANRLLFAGYRKVLTMSDLFILDKKLRAEKLHRNIVKIDPSRFNGGRNALTWALVRILAVHLLLPVIPRMALLALSLCQPLLIKSLLDYLSQKETKTDNTGYGLIGATLLIYIGMPLMNAVYRYYHQRFLFMLRSLLIDLVYRKTTRAIASSADDSKAVTLMSTDVERIQTGFLLMHELWATPIQVAVSYWLLYRQLGPAFAASIVVIAVCGAVSAFVLRFVGARQAAWMKRIETRVGKTANVIANMKNIKISGLACAVEGAIQNMRVDELNIGNKFRGMTLILIAVGFTPGHLSSVFTFAVTSRDLDVSTVFTSVTLLSLLADPLNGLFQLSPTIIAALTCLQRVQNYIEAEERQDFRQFRFSKDHPNKASNTPRSSPRIKITSGDFGWETEKLTLNNINASIMSGLNIVVGPVASGKSTLCKVLLGETPVSRGEIIMNDINSTKVGFCDQVPFLQNKTIENNIIGFAARDESRYAQVIDASMLKPDFLLLPRGDQTKIGSNGISLSGGQKQRIAIARALYQQCDLFIFDDVLSGLDVDTEQHVFINIFGPDGFLKKKSATVVLCTHAIRHLPMADHVIALGNNGTVVEEGTFTDLVSNKQYIHSLGLHDEKPYTSSQTEGGSTLAVKSDKTVAPDLTTKEVEAAGSSVQDDDNRKVPVRTFNDSAIFLHYFKSIGPFWLAIFLLCGLTCGFLWSFPNVWLKFWVDDGALKEPKHSAAYYIGVFSLLQTASLIFVVIECGIGLLIITKLSGAKLHKEALRTIFAAPLHFFTVTDVGVVTNLFSQDMTLIDGDLPEAFVDTSAMFWIVLGTLAVAATASPYVLIVYPFIIAVAYTVQMFYLRTSRQLRLLDLEAKSPLYTNFLDTIKGAVTLRAFAWTENFIVQNNALLDNSTNPAYLLGIIQRWLTFILSMLIGALAFLVVTLSTQLHSDSGFTGASLVSIISSGGFLGSLIQHYTLMETSLGAVNRLKTFSEKTAVEDLPNEDVRLSPSWPEKGRIEIENVSASYGPSPALNSEESEKDQTEINLGLQDLNLTIESGEKVAICGRTGSGKSSLVLLLLRLLDPVQSSSFTLAIDGLPLREVHRATLRQRLIAVPQDAVFLPDGTSFMRNLDPGDTATEAECKSALEAVNMWEFVSSRGGLSGGLAIDSLSQGQKQLFSLSRAILRRRIRTRQIIGEVGESYLDPSRTKGSNNRSHLTIENELVGGSGRGVLILDEYSSSLDRDTDRSMQQIIHKEFEGYTIIMVTHRLEMVMDFDKVVVLDAGKVAENGVPRKLVKQKGSRFRDLWVIGKTK